MCELCPDDCLLHQYNGILQSLFDDAPMRRLSAEFCLLD